MAYLFIAIVVLTIAYIVFKAIKKRKLPSNEYTPFDDITSGKSKKDL
ncbi:DUF3951 domain-containing protein [Metabacillus fastidiosus]|nr:DUF3951 domain-containing protein [Metabacillus fastidiosus]